MKSNKTPMPPAIRRDIIEITLTLVSVAGLAFWALSVFKLPLWWLEFLLVAVAGLLLGIKPLLKRGHVGIVGIVIVVILLILSYVPSNDYVGYAALGVSSLYIGYAGLELYRSVRKGKALAQFLGDTNIAAYKSRLEARKPSYVPSGYTEVLTQKKKTDFEKDSVKIFFQIKGTDSLITLTESNGPPSTDFNFKINKLGNVPVKDVPVTVHNRVEELSERQSKNQMDALWNYKGQSYQLSSNAVTWNELQKMINSLID
jgi:hypothetical protein